MLGIVSSSVAAWALLGMPLVMLIIYLLQAQEVKPLDGSPEAAFTAALVTELSATLCNVLKVFAEFHVRLTPEGPCTLTG